jgi:hypothetical protein
MCVTPKTFNPGHLLQNPQTIMYLRSNKKKLVLIDGSNFTASSPGLKAYKIPLILSTMMSYLITAGDPSGFG